MAFEQNSLQNTSLKEFNSSEIVKNKNASKQNTSTDGFPNSSHKVVETDKRHIN